jgi:hypothetical protein
MTTRWGDDSDSEDEVAHAVQTTSETGHFANGNSLAADMLGDPSHATTFALEKSGQKEPTEGVEEPLSDDDEPSQEDLAREKRLQEAKQRAAEKRLLQKQPKAEEDLDAILNELGIEPTKETDGHLTVVDEHIQHEQRPTPGALKNKRKPKNKKKKNTTEEITTEDIAADTTPLTATPADVAAILKAKTVEKKKKATSAATAAAVAAKELKSKPVVAVKKTKAKTKEFGR